MGVTLILHCFFLFKSLNFSHILLCLFAHTYRRVSTEMTSVLVLTFHTWIKGDRSLLCFFEFCFVRSGVLFLTFGQGYSGDRCITGNLHARWRAIFSTLVLYISKSEGVLFLSEGTHVSYLEAVVAASFTHSVVYWPPWTHAVAPFPCPLLQVLTSLFLHMNGNRRPPPSPWWSQPGSLLGSVETPFRDDSWSIPLYLYFHECETPNTLDGSHSGHK